MEVADLVLPVFAVIVTGWLTGWVGYISRSLADGLVHFAYNVAMPALLLVTIAQESARNLLEWRFLLAFERAELSSDPAEQRRLLTFVIVGGGATGVEMAGAMAEVARQTLQHDFRRIDPDRRPGSSRAYAIVVEDGVIHPGDPAVVELASVPSTA